MTVDPVAPIIGITASLMIAAGLYWWYSSWRRHTRTIDSFDVRILVTGSRGKSSVVRLLHAVLVAAGRRPYARITGTDRLEIGPDGEEWHRDRYGQVTVLEMMDSAARAEAAGSDCLVFECMAVAPELIDLTQRRIVRAQVAVLTNARIDHLEDQGLDRASIAATMAGVAQGAELLITAEQHDDAADAIATVCAQLDVPCKFAIAADVQAELLTVLEGARLATHEDHDGVETHCTPDGTDLAFLDLGSINEPESLNGRIGDFLDGGGATRAIVLADRWDRPLRSIEFAAYLDPASADVAFVAGPTYRPARAALRRSGWPAERIAPLRRRDVRSVARFVDKVHRHAPPDRPTDRVRVVGLVNEHQPVAADLQRSLAAAAATAVPDVAAGAGSEGA